MPVFGPPRKPGPARMDPVVHTSPRWLLWQPAPLDQTVHALRRAAKELRLFVGRVTGCQAFEGVPQHRVARTDAVRRKIALEHAAIGAERRDTGLEIRLVRACQFLR